MKGGEGVEGVKPVLGTFETFSNLTDLQDLRNRRGGLECGGLECGGVECGGLESMVINIVLMKALHSFDGGSTSAYLNHARVIMDPLHLLDSSLGRESDS